MRNAAKMLRFPFGGLAKDGSYRDTTYPSDESAYSSPMAKNVIGECAFSSRLRGGSRPGLKRVEGDVSGMQTARWLWPNGEVIEWPDGAEMVFDTFSDAVSMPDGSAVIMGHPVSVVYRNRLFKADGSVWMASRTGNFGDFDFGGEADDVTKACAGNLAFAGRKGETVTAFAPFGDSRIFIATRRSLAVISGEPTTGMSILSENVGIIGADAWCNADGVLYFIGPNGMYSVAEGGPLLVSGRLPDDLKGLDYAILVYDPERRGIHMFTDRDDWYFDIANKAFWPVEYPPQMMPDAGGVAMIDGVNRVVFHCVDGKWRYWDEGSEDDDGVPIPSSVAIGPFKCGVNDDVDGMLDAVTATFANGSESVGMTVYTAHSAEDAVRALTEDDVGEGYVSDISFTDGWNPVVRPRIRGAWAIIKLDSVGRWAYESMQANIKTFGRLRP